MTESESVALPLGDAPIFSTVIIIAENSAIVNSNFQLFERIYSFFQKNRKKSQNLLYNGAILWYNMKVIYPWHSWIARQTPTLKASGSNPLG